MIICADTYIPFPRPLVYATYRDKLTVTTLEGATQTIARGPVAHFEIIKMLGENGGAFFAGNSAHPFENPNGGSNLLEIVASN